MFGKLFGSGKPRPTPGQPPRPAPVKAKRVNLVRRFTLIAETGQGSMSKVYRAVDNETGRTICLKVQDSQKTAAAIARSASVGRLSEGEIAQKIIHPNVVRTFDWGLSTKGEYYIVMEFIDGVSLIYCRESKNLALPEKIELLAQAADALAAVHHSGFIHRDFGPKNLLVNRENQVKLIDFGLAVPNTPAFRRPGNRTGTLTYMAPELVRREPTDERIDIFSFGVTAFEFLSGRLPYDVNPADPMAVMRSRINNQPLKLEDVAPRIPAQLAALVNRTLAKRPEDRWPSAETLGAAFRELI
ncbi:MAG: serine/threonine protein kinase [Isosphaeraceae bacterium]|jgi:serine/threonine protein kinase|nr:MAG: serine/threonine protein kinase [Isosphaeraceae bacterium]